MKIYYDPKSTKQPDIEVGNLVMLNGKNICTKRAWKKLSPKLYGTFKIMEKKGNRAYKLEISPRWKIHPMFQVCLLEGDGSSNRRTRERPSRDPEDIEGDFDCEVERIVKSDITSPTQKGQGRNTRMKELRYFVNWKSCAEDENTGELGEAMTNAQEGVERFRRESLRMPDPGEVE